MIQPDRFRIYLRNQSIVFLRTNEAFGGLSNMAIGFEIFVGKIIVKSSEALYQACRYPHLSDIQKKIINQNKPIAAKMESYPFMPRTRKDWDSVRIPIMRWCLKAKLACNWTKVRDLLLSTGDKPIVEESRKDEFWGAIPQDNGELRGENNLGRLLIELREELKGVKIHKLRTVLPLDIINFNLLGSPIPVIRTNMNYE